MVVDIPHDLQMRLNSTHVTFLTVLYSMHVCISVQPTVQVFAVKAFCCLLICFSGVYMYIVDSLVYMYVDYLLFR